MNRRFQLVTWLMWLALPTAAWNYWRAWDRLPMRMAVHFDANWQPNGWTSREGALLLALGVMAFLLVVFTVAAYAVQASKPNSVWPVLIAFCFVLAFVWEANNWIVTTNLNRSRAHPPPLNINVR